MLRNSIRRHSPRYQNLQQLYTHNLNAQPSRRGSHYGWEHHQYAGVPQLTGFTPARLTAIGVVTGPSCKPIKLALLKQGTDLHPGR